MADAAVKEKQVKLQVANARAEESGGGIARIPRSAMAELGVTEGDIVQISGKRETASRVEVASEEVAQVTKELEQEVQSFLKRVRS